MREIKFRAWNKLTNQMIYDIQEDKLHHQKIITSFGFMLKKNNYEIMQFTGLYDKNGVEIYEGDLIKINFDIHTIEDYVFLSLSDEEKNQRYFIKEVKIPEIYQETLSDDYEVIGNIYDKEVEE